MKVNTKVKSLGAGLIAALTLSGTIATPMAALAQDGRDRGIREGLERLFGGQRGRDSRDRDRDREDRGRRDNDWNRGRRDNDWNRGRGNRDWDEDRYDRRDRDNRDDRDWRDRRDWDSRDDFRGGLRRESDRRQETKNNWRNLGYLGGAAALFGLLKGDRTVMFAGAAGALYSTWRYEQDRKSQSRVDQARADLFGRSSFERDGVRYNRRTVWQNGQQYYQFCRE